MGLKLRKYLIILLISGMSFTISGCDKDIEMKNDESEITNITQETKTEYKKEEATNSKIEDLTDITETTNDIIGESETESEKSKDEIIINYYNDAKNKINEYKNSEDYSNIKVKGKELFTTTIDFLFYGEDIKGVYLKDITSTTKLLVVERFIEADQIIEEYIPNYKDGLSDKYEKASSTLKTLAESFGDKITDYLGDELVDEYGNLKDDLLNTLGDTGVKIKDKANEWYQNFKNSD